MSGYLSHFGLREPAFSTTPDPRFAYSTREHQLAVNKIQYVVEERQGFFLLQGENGTGKTTVSEFLQNGWDEDKSLAVAYVSNPAVRTPSQFLRLILTAYAREQPRFQQECWDALSGFLADNHRQGRTTVLIIDEAQTISAENMETLTHISNLQTQRSKLIQIVLLAQPNIVRKLTYKPALRDRIAHGSVLNPLTKDDAEAMLRFRMKEAGGDFDATFPGDIIRPIYNATKGVPRRLCMLCDNMLLNAYAMRRKTAGPEELESALHDLKFKGWKD
jgi:general secretion pathway protein A